MDEALDLELARELAAKYGDERFIAELEQAIFEALQGRRLSNG